MTSNYYRRLVVDIDDTISFTTNRDWENAHPNTALIKKLNYLYDNGWEIHYYTARGCVSFENDRQAADDHYRPIIQQWFKKNNVKYTNLSFNKELAAYYIDDKAILPDDFLNLDIEILEGGLSGAIIEKRGNKVYKTHPNSLDAASWYKKASNIIKTVDVHSIIGDTLCIEYIKKTDDYKIEQIDFIIDKFKNVPANVDFSTYKNRILDHMNLYNPEYKDFVQDLLSEHEDFFNRNKSFCHGDMSLDNMINSDNILYLIDPIYVPDLYSSWLLDVSKVLHSAKRFKKPLIYDYFLKKYENISFELKLLELTHWIRMRKYENKKKINELDGIINSIITDLEEQEC